MSQESILSTVDTLLGELEELKRKLAAKETQKIMDVQSNNQVAELEKEVMDLRMENGRLFYHYVVKGTAERRKRREFG